MCVIVCKTNFGSNLHWNRPTNWKVESCSEFSCHNDQHCAPEHLPPRPCGKPSCTHAAVPLLVVLTHSYSRRMTLRSIQCSEVSCRCSEKSCCRFLLTRAKLIRKPMKRDFFRQDQVYKILVVSTLLTTDTNRVNSLISRLWSSMSTLFSHWTCRIHCVCLRRKNSFFFFIMKSVLLLYSLVFSAFRSAKHWRKHKRKLNTHLPCTFISSPARIIPSVT